MTRRRAGLSTDDAAGPTLAPRLGTMLSRAVSIATAFLEVRDGHRPVTHLDTWVAEPVARQLRGLVRRRRRMDTPTRARSVRRVFVDHQQDRVNAVVIVNEDGDVRSVAVELRGDPRCPTVTRLGLPDDQRPRPAQVPDGPVCPTIVRPEAPPHVEPPPTTLAGVPAHSA